MTMYDDVVTDRETEKHSRSRYCNVSFINLILLTAHPRRARAHSSFIYDSCNLNFKERENPRGVANARAPSLNERVDRKLVVDRHSRESALRNSEGTMETDVRFR
ncbi:hypothetical protein P5V15_003891 [Pogonomyrmex californicus]